MDLDPEACQVARHTENAVLYALRFHDLNWIPTVLAYRHVIRTSVAGLWPLRTQAQDERVAHLEIAGDVAVTCAHVYNQRNPNSPPVNERWLYNCVQNLLTVHLKPELLDSPVPRLRDMVNQSGAAGDGSANSNGLLGDNNTGRKRGELHPHSEKEDGNNSSESFIVNSSSSTLLGREPSSRGPSANSDEEHGYHDDEDDDNSESSVVTSNHGDNLPFDDLDPSNFAVPITTTIKIRPTAATGTHAATSAHAATGAYAATGHAAAAAHAATKHATAAAHAAAAAAAARKEPKTPWTEDDIELMIRLKDFDGLTHEEVAARIGRGKGSVENKYGRVLKEAEWKRWAEECRQKSGRGRGGWTATATASSSNTTTTTNNKRRAYGDGDDEDEDDGEGCDEGVGPSPKKQRC